MKKSILPFVLFLFFVPVQAEQIFHMCNSCYSTADVNNEAEMITMTLSPGQHSAVIVNELTSKIWDVRVNVSGDSGGQSFPGFSDNTVEVIYTHYLPTDSHALSVLLSLVDDPIVVDTRLAPNHNFGLIESLCPSANNGSCTALNHYLYNLPRTVLYRQYLTTPNLIKLVWRRLFGDDLIFVVIFPDGSIGAYKYNGSVSVNSIQAVNNTATNASGEISNIGGYIGLEDDINAPGYSQITYGGHGSSGDCTVAITSADQQTYRVTVHCE